jgi:hypothetical protein
MILKVTERYFHTFTDPNLSKIISTENLTGFVQADLILGQQLPLLASPDVMVC